MTAIYAAEIERLDINTAAVTKVIKIIKDITIGIEISQKVF